MLKKHCVQTKRIKSGQVMLDWIGKLDSFPSFSSSSDAKWETSLCPARLSLLRWQPGSIHGAAELKPPEKCNFFLLVSCPLISGEHAKPGEMRLWDLAKGIV